MGHLHRVAGPAPRVSDSVTLDDRDLKPREETPSPLSPATGERGRGAGVPTFTQRVVASALLSVLFLAVYGFTNWFTTQRSDVGVWYFDWELAIPLLPLMIVPYMSIDLFFIAAPFLCDDTAELKTLAKRITFAILVAGTFFLLMPLKLGFERGPIDGWLGAIFDGFRGMDAPHNLFPSLHITLRFILAEIYARHTRGLVRVAILVWFSLIGFSTVLTHQHHLVDIAGGAVLAGFAFYLFRDRPESTATAGNRRVGVYYLAGAVAVLVAAIFAWPLGAFFLWPAAALGLVSAGYFGAGPGIYRKTDGRLPLSTRFVFAPVLLGQWLSLLHYRRHCRAWDEAAPGVLIGRKLSDAEAGEAVAQGVTAVLDLTAEFAQADAFLAVTYRNVQVQDLTAPTLEQMREAAAFIAQEAARGKVYVHCKIGYSRSAAMVGAYLIASGVAGSVEEALTLLRQARPSIIIRREAVDALHAFARDREILQHDLTP